MIDQETRNYINNTLQELPSPSDWLFYEQIFMRGQLSAFESQIEREREYTREIREMLQK